MRKTGRGNWATIILATVIMAILLAVRIWDKLGEVWRLIFYISTFVITISISSYMLYRRIKNVNKNNAVYIVEDVFISVAEKNVFSNRVNSIKYGSRYEYDIKFSCNGIGHIVLLSKNEPKEIDADYSAVFFSKPGDKFYLLISKL